MKLTIKNLGVIKQAEFRLGELTIICGENNTGKTYATYALFGFLYFWRRLFRVDIPDADIQVLLREGSVELDIQDYMVKVKSILDKGCAAYTQQLSQVFASSEKLFANSHFALVLDANDLLPVFAFERIMGAANSELFSISKKADSQLVSISLLVEKAKVKIPPDLIRRIIGDALKEILFGHLFPRPFIAVPSAPAQPYSGKNSTLRAIGCWRKSAAWRTMLILSSCSQRSTPTTPCR
jgi:hypothetical protein